MLRVATIVEDTRAEGPGRRWALWVQGCALRCAGCCNPEMFDPRRGAAVEEAALITQISAARRGGVEGISVLGGEPFEQAAGLAVLAEHARAIGLTVMVFSGYQLAELRARPDAAALLACTDVLVDGRFDHTRPEPAPPVGRRWIGSTNQQRHHLSAAYAEDDPAWRGANTIEIRLSRSALRINGWPSADRVLDRRRG